MRALYSAQCTCGCAIVRIGPKSGGAPMRFGDPYVFALFVSPHNDVDDQVAWLEGLSAVAARWSRSARRALHRCLKAEGYIFADYERRKGDRVIRKRVRL